MINRPIMSHTLGKYWKMQPEVDTCQGKEIKKYECELKRSSQTSRILSASCLQQDQVSGPHKSVYFSKTCILVCSSLNTHVHHSAHEELKKLHLEQSFMLYWNVCCGWKLSLCGGKWSVIYYKALPLAANIWMHLILCLHKSRQCALVPYSGICLLCDCQKWCCLMDNFSELSTLCGSRPAALDRASKKGKKW